MVGVSVLSPKMNADQCRLVNLPQIGLCAGVFLLAALAGVAGGRFLTADDDRREAAPLKSGPAAALLPDTDAGWLASAWRTEEEIAARVGALGLQETRSLLHEIEGVFWRGHPNGAETFRHAIGNLMKGVPPHVALAEVRSWLDQWQCPKPAWQRLWREAVAIACAHPDFDRSTVAALMRGRSEDEIFGTLQAVLEARPAASAKEALAEALAFIAAAGVKDDEALKAKAQAFVCETWLIRAPEQALRLAASTDRDAIRYAFHEPLRKMRALDPEGAKQALRMASELGVYPEAIGETAFMAGFSPEELRTAFAGASPENLRRYVELYASRAHQMAPSELADIASVYSAKDLVREASGAGNSQFGTFAVIHALRERDPVAFEQWLALLEAKVRRMLLDEVLAYPALMDTGFARFYLEEAGAGSEIVAPGTDLHRVILAIAEEDPDNALSLLHRVPEDHRASAERSIRARQIEKMLIANPDEAMDLAEIAPARLRHDLLGFALARRYEEDPVGAERWLQTVQEPELRRFLEIHLEATGAADPAASVLERCDRLLSMGASPEEFAVALNGVIHSSPWLDPERAGSLMLRLPSAELQATYTEIVTSRWAARDPAGAAAWTATLSPGPNQDRAAAAIMYAIQNQPVDALAWASAVTNPQLRFESVKTLVTAWAMADLGVAERLVGDAPVTAEQRRALEAVLASTPQARREGRGR